MVGVLKSEFLSSLSILLIGGYWGTTCHTKSSDLCCSWVVWKQMLGWSLGCKSAPMGRAEERVEA